MNRRRAACTGVEGDGLRVLTWNLQWVKLTWWRAGPILARMRREAADVAVLTEAQVPLARELYEHTADAGPHPKARQPDGSKVIVASHHPLDVVDIRGSDDLPPGNFAAVDVLPAGEAPLRIIGVVIRYNQKREYIGALPPILARLTTERTVFAADFNLSMLRSRPLERTLTATLENVGLKVATADPWPALVNESPLIDHIALSSGLRAEDVRVWPRHINGEERRLTDHAGVSLGVRAAAVRR